MLIPDVLLHKEEEEEKKRKKKKKTKVGNVLCSLVSVIVNGGSLSLADSLTVPVCVADPPADIELNRSEKENKKNTQALFASSSLYVPCLLPFSLVLIPRVRVIDRSFLFDG
jgi:hypothetical protein